MAGSGLSVGSETVSVGLHFYLESFLMSSDQSEGEGETTC